MESFAGINQNFQHSLRPNHQSYLSPFSKPISTTTISFQSLSKPKTSSLIRASSFHQPSQNPNKNNPPPTPPLHETLTPLSSLLKTTCLTIATTALFFNRFHKPSIASPIPQSTLEEESSTTNEEEEKEKTLDEYLSSHPDDVKALKAVMEVKIELGKIEEAISIVDRLIELEPTEKEWVLFKSYLFSNLGEVELAKLGFEELLAKDPLFVEAYQGLVNVAVKSETSELENILKRIENAMEMCKKEKKKDDLRDLKLLVAKVKVGQKKYTEALKIHQELVKEDPRDFRPYLCQGMIYTLLNNKDEAHKHFQKYRRLVPKGHPYSRFFEEHLKAATFLSQAVENQKM